MTDDDQRNESYPSAPPVGWQPSEAECAARRAFIDRRNFDIAVVGAQRALDAAKGGSIGGMGKGKA